MLSRGQRPSATVTNLDIDIVDSTPRGYHGALNQGGDTNFTIDGSVDDALGTYILTYTATDANGNTATATRTVHVVPPAVDYLVRNPDLQIAFGSDLDAARTHYQQYGSTEDRDTSPLGACGNTGGIADLADLAFDPCRYLNHHADLKAEFGSGNVEAAYRHFFDSGLSEGLQSNEAFHIRAYIDRNVQVVVHATLSYSDNAAAYAHWYQHGQAAGLSALPLIDPLEGPTATLTSGYYTVKGQIGKFLWGDGTRFYATSPDPQSIRIENKGNGQFSLRGPAQWLGTDDLVHTGPIDVAVEKVFRLVDLDGGQFALLLPEHVDGPYVFADYRVDGGISIDSELFYGGWIFTIEPTEEPVNPDAADYLAANADLTAVFGSDHAAALAHYQQYGWAEGRPTAP